MLTFVLLVTCFVAHIQGLALTVSTTGGNASSPLLYGLMFEDINHSGDGTLHGQLLQNNGFQGVNKTLTAYDAVGGTTLSVDDANPLTTAITHSLKVSVPSGTTGQVGFSNSGYWGIPVNKDTYTSSFFVKGDYSGDITVALKGIESGTTFASKTVTIDSNSTDFTYVDVGSFTSTQAPDGNNIYTLTFSGTTVSSSSLNFALPQLFPTTFKNRTNGLRSTVAQAINNIGGSFLRFPGGNNIEGETSDTRWKWNETIGALENRPGRDGDWTYPNTDALGLIEYLLWCEDMDLTAVLAVWDGYSLDHESITGDALTPYIDDALAELEFLLGSTSTTGGALRSSLGYPEPFTISYVEIGNEDNFEGCTSYPERFTAFYNAIHSAYPSITLISSTASSSCLPSPFPTDAWQDIHHYQKPNEFINMFNEWDNADRSIGIFVGEYASTTSNSGDKTYWTDMIGSVSEAVYMIGMERNSDIVKMASYAPLLQLWNSTQWTPNMIGYNTNPDGLVLSTSYYVQKMFASYRGDTILPVSSDSDFNPLFWVASSTGSNFFVKLANYGDGEQDVSVGIEGTVEGSLVLFEGEQTQENVYGQALIEPGMSSITGSGGVFNFTMPAWSVAVLAVS